MGGLMLQTKDGLTEKQAETLTMLKTYIQKYGYPPTVRELGMLLNLKSTGSAFARLKLLQHKGYISVEEGKARAIKIL